MAEAPEHHSMTRRALLRGSATAAAAVAVTTLPIAAAAALPEPDPVLDAWRAWRPLEEEAARLSVDRDDLEATFPEWVSSPGASFGRGWRRSRSSAPCYSIAMYDDLAKIGDPGHQEIMGMDRANFVRRLRRANARAEAYRERSGWTGLRTQINALRDQQQPFLVTIAGSMSLTPVALAAKIDVGFSYCADDDLLQTPAHVATCSILCALLPQLPPDMAAAMKPFAKGFVNGSCTVREAYLRGAGGAA